MIKYNFIAYTNDYQKVFVRLALPIGGQLTGWYRATVLAEPRVMSKMVE